MFDTKVFKEGDTRIDVKMLPHDTADAARLYGEMVKKAQEELRGATIREANAGIRVVVVKLEAENNYENYDTEVRVLFSVNGHNYDFKTQADMIEQDVYKVIGDHVAAEVVAKLSAGRKHL